MAPKPRWLQWIWILLWCRQVSIHVVEFSYLKIISNCVWSLLCWLFKRNHTIKTKSEFVCDLISPPIPLVHVTTLWKCIEMRACMLLYLLCACDAIRTPLLSIICGVSVPHSARTQWGYFSQPSIQTWPITARLQKHFPCTQELTAVNGGYFQSLCCQSKCQVNTGQWKQL